MVAELLYPLVYKIQPLLAGKVTSALIDEQFLTLNGLDAVLRCVYA